MSVNDLYNLSLDAPAQVTDELYNNVGSATFQLGTVKRAFLGDTNFEIWDGPLDSNSIQLVENTDYTLEDEDIYYSELKGSVVYTGVKIVNPTYQTGNIYITYKVLGSYTDANSITDNFLALNDTPSSYSGQAGKVAAVKGTEDGLEFITSGGGGGGAGGSDLFTNAIINGNFDVAQRNVSFPSVANGDYTLDRWVYEKSGAMVHDITQDSDVPDELSQNSIKIDCTTIDPILTPTEYSFIAQKIEGFNIFPFINRTVTLSFWVKATKTGIYCVSFRNSGPDRSYVVEYTVNSADTWEKKEITFNMHDGLSGTWDFTDGLGLKVTFCLGAGATYQTTPDVWQTGNFFATSNQVNGVDNTANNFFLSQVKFEDGSSATDFQPRHYESELELCLRYFQKSGNRTEYLGSAWSMTGSPELYFFGNCNSVSSYLIEGTWPFTKRMRSDNPTMVLYNSVGTANRVEAWGTTWNTFIPTFVDSSATGVRFGCTQNAGTTDRRGIRCHYIADAEI